MRGPLIVLLAAGLALVAAAPASAAPAPAASRYAAFTATSTTAGTGSLAAGFPAISYSGDAPIGVATSASLRAGSGAGVEHGASTGATYLTITPVSSTQASTTTIVFAAPAPPAGWSFVLGDIDAESVRITATGPNGPVAPADLGFQGGFSNLKPPGTDVAVWDAGTSTLSGGFADGHNTDGAFGWFSPSVPVTALTLVSTRVAGFPLAQFWMVGHVATLSGTVSTPEGAPAAGADVAIAPSDGAGAAEAPLTVTTVTDASGAFSVPDVLAVPSVATVTVPGRPARTTLVDPLRITAPVDPADPPDPAEPARTVPVWDVPLALLTAAAPAAPVARTASAELAPSGVPVLPVLEIAGSLLLVGVVLLAARAGRAAARRRGAGTTRS